MDNVVTKITSGSLIAAGQVQGTNVYNPDGEALGTVADIMIDKVSGMDKGDVVYRPVATTSGPGVLWMPAKRISLAQLAAEVESEISPDAV